MKYELLTGEINPLVILPDNRIIALDAKVEVDDNALFRQKFEQKFWEDVISWRWKPAISV